MRILTVFFLIGVASGCGASVSPYARASAGRIGCPAESISLTQLERDGGSPQSWVASCGRAAYACSSNTDPRSPQAHVVCSAFGRPHRELSWRW